MMSAAGRMELIHMPPMTLVTGSMMSGDPDRARLSGAMIHYVVMGTVAFGLLYAALFAAFGSASLLTGVVIGAVHGVFVGAVAMPMMPAMHPRMTGSLGPGGAVVDTSGGGVVLAASGDFGSGWASMTPIGLMIGHVVFGPVVALVYGILV
ncbi:hypothetical protein BH23ACT5_BH23ACT5_22380 [soil metagenome]